MESRIVLADNESSARAAEVAIRGAFNRGFKTIAFSLTPVSSARLDVSAFHAHGSSVRQFVSTSVRQFVISSVRHFASTSVRQFVSLSVRQFCVGVVGYYGVSWVGKQVTRVQ